MSICRLSAASEALAVMDSELAGWLAGVIRKLKAGLPADQALELSGPGAKRERDRHIVMAATVLRQNDTLWSLAGRLAEFIASPSKRYPSEAEQLVEELLQMAASAAPLPRTQRHLYAVMLNSWDK